ncbi:MAG: isochorismatase family protein [Candidatus Cryptobacteroides sp.]
MKSKVLVVVDVQRDFFDPSGSLYVGGSEELPAKIAEIADSYDAVIFTLDWHPANHCSFAANGGQWPSHCVAYTQGAGIADEFAPVLASGKARLFLKGQEQDKEQYGAFENLAEDSVEYSWLSNADSVDVCGIAGDYCVKESTANILKVVAPEKVSILMDCVRSIDGGEVIDAFISEKGISKK